MNLPVEGKHRGDEVRKKLCGDVVVDRPIWDIESLMKAMRHVPVVKFVPEQSWRFKAEAGAIPKQSSRQPKDNQKTKRRIAD
jgi:hypothetical protein